MKIYSIALAIFVFCSFNAAIQEMGVFGNIYSHTNTIETNIDEDDIADLKLISGDDLLSDTDMANSNPDQGGISSLIKGLKVLFNVLDKTLNVNKLILEYTPPSAYSTVEPLASFFGNIMLVVYAAGILSYYRKWSVD